MEDWLFAFLLSYISTDQHVVQRNIQAGKKLSVSPVTEMAPSTGPSHLQSALPPMWILCPHEAEAPTAAPRPRVSGFGP